MDAKVTLSFDEQVIKEAKVFAARNGISLSRLTEFIYKQMTAKDYRSLEDLPIADWVDIVAEGELEYGKPHSRKQLKSAFYESKK